MERIAELILAAAAQPKPLGQVEWTTPGTYSWVVPAGLYFISPVCVSGGWGSGFGSGTVAGNAGRGADLRWGRAISVSPGETLTIVVGAGGVGKTVASASPAPSAPGASSILRGGTVLLQADGNGGGTTIALPNFGGGNGGAGGTASNTRGPGGGGAGGYSGNGSAGANGSDGSDTLGAAGGGGSGGKSGTTLGGNGGGVGIRGEGLSGAGVTSGIEGNPGSSGVGPLYGGGAPGRSGNVAGLNGASGAVRIIYPAPARAYPSTRTANE